MNQTFGEHLKSVAAYAFLATIFMAGFGVGAAIWSSSISPLQSENGRLKEELSVKSAELNQVKTEYALFRQEQGSSTKNNANIPTQIKTDLADSVNSIETFQINIGSSRDFFNGDIVISLIETPFGESGLYHTVYATIGAVGFKNIIINKKEVGYAVEFNSSKKYEIRVISADTFTATFRVTLKK